MHSSAERYGSDLACLRIAAAALHDGWEVEVLLPCLGPLVDDLRTAGATVFLLDPIVVRRADLVGWGLLLVPFRYLRGAVGLRGFARSRPAYDVVQSNCAPTLGGALIARWSGARHVWYVHEIFSSRFQRRLFGWLLAVSADRVLTCSSAALAQFPGVVSRGHGRVAYTGVEMPAGIVPSDVLDGPGPVVVCVGRLNSWKGQEVLLASVARLRARGIDVRAQIVGSVYRQEHHYEERLRALSELLGIAGQVTFLGERRDALEVVARADIAVVPSTRPEPFGMVLVEAMALGRAVVASAAGGPAEIITDGKDGLLVAPGDALALADALQRLIEAPDFARSLGAQASVRAADFTSRKMTDQVLATCEDLLTEGRR